VLCGGSRQDNDWSEGWDEELGNDILKRCCELCPDLGRPEDLQVIAKNVGLRREFILAYILFDAIERLMLRAKLLTTREF